MERGENAVNQNKLLILMVILVFIAVTLGVTCLMLDKFPAVDWDDLFAGATAGESSDPIATGPSKDTTPVETTTAPTTEATTEPDLTCKGLVLSDGVLELKEVGETYVLLVTTDPIDTTDTVFFASGDMTIAVVDANGTVTAVSAGETVITVSCGTLKATCKVICSIPEETTEETTEATTEAVIQDTGYQAAMLAVDQLGKPYRYGGAGPDDFDASGLLYYCYGQLGISVPRSTSEQAKFGQTISREELKPGDAIFLWSSNPGQPESVAIYVGNSVAIASFNDKRPVFEFNIESNYYSEHFVYAKRFY